MAAPGVLDELRSLVQSVDFEADSYKLTQRWVSSGFGAETIEPILQFIEENPSIDFGSPGPLVHFIERFYGAEYKEKLLASLDRKPTGHTAWMMNRVINGTHEVNLKYSYIAALKRARLHPDTDWDTRKQIEQFLEALSA
jgi:hypothetical protein